MITVTLSDELEAAVVSHEAVSLEIDRRRLQSYLNGAPGISQKCADAWLSQLAAGKWSAFPLRR